VRIVLLLLVAASAALPQRLSVGLKLGHPFKDVFKTGVTADRVINPSSGRYTIGPTVELYLPHRVSVEMDLLYRPAKYTSDPATTASEWRLPLLVKYRLRGGVVAPFVAGGVAWQFFSGVSNDTEQVKSSTTGGVMAAGLEGKLPFFRLSGELRYTRWGAATFRNVVGGVNRSSLNQVDFLMGVTF
jgi:hypothetical protein